MSEDLQTSLEAWQTSFSLSEVQVRFDAINSEILNATQDVLLSENVREPLHVPHSELYAHCIRGIVERTYDAKRSYEEVLSDYAKTFAEMGWQDQAAFDTGVVVYHEKARRSTVSVVIEPEPIPEESYRAVDPVEFQTLYLVRFRYAEPSIESCWE